MSCSKRALIDCDVVKDCIVPNVESRETDLSSFYQLCFIEPNKQSTDVEDNSNLEEDLKSVSQCYNYSDSEEGDVLSSVLSLNSAVFSVLSRAKLLNLIDQLSNVFVADSFVSALAPLARICELYGYLWSDVNGQMGVLEILWNVLVWMKDLIVPLFKGSKLVPDDVKSRLPDTEPVKQAFVKLSEDRKGKIKSFFENIGCHELAGRVPYLVPVLATVVTGALAFVAFRFGPAMLQQKEMNFVKSVTAMGMLARSSHFLRAEFASIWKVATDCFAEIFGLAWVEDADIEVKKYISDLHSLYKEFRQYQNRILSDPYVVFGDQEFLPRLELQLKRLDDFYLRLASAKKNMVNAKSALDSLREMAKESRLLVDNIKRTCTEKIEPVVIWLSGAAGIGKSRAVSKIVEELGKLHGEVLHTYVRGTADQYWSGYSGQPVVIYDDFGNSKEKTEFTELVSIKTCQAFLLNCAAVEEKGKLFTSKYVIICANMLDVVNTAQIPNVEVLNRRRDFLFVVENPELTNYVQVNGREPTADCDIWKDDFSHLTIRRRAALPRDRDAVRDNSEWDVFRIAQESYVRFRTAEQKFYHYLTDLQTRRQRLQDAVEDKDGLPSAPVCAVRGGGESSVSDSEVLERFGFLFDTDEPERQFFHQFERQIHMPILFVGEAGTGKTFTMHAIRRRFEQEKLKVRMFSGTQFQTFFDGGGKVTKYDVILIEDFTVTAEAMNAFRTFVNEAEDGFFGKKIVVATGNLSLVHDHAAGRGVDWLAAFERRVRIYQFSFKRRWLFKYTPADVVANPENYDVMVRISASTLTTQERSDLFQRDLIDFVVQATPRVALYQTFESLPKIGEVEATFEVVLKVTPSDFLKWMKSKKGVYTPAGVAAAIAEVHSMISVPFSKMVFFGRFLHSMAAKGIGLSLMSGWRTERNMLTLRDILVNVANLNIEFPTSEVVRFRYADEAYLLCASDEGRLCILEECPDGFVRQTGSFVGGVDYTKDEKEFMQRVSHVIQRQRVAMKEKQDKCGKAFERMIVSGGLKTLPAWARALFEAVNVLLLYGTAVVTLQDSYVRYRQLQDLKEKKNLLDEFCTPELEGQKPSKVEITETFVLKDPKVKGQPEKVSTVVHVNGKSYREAGMASWGSDSSLSSNVSLPPMMRAPKPTARRSAGGGGGTSVTLQDTPTYATKSYSYMRNLEVAKPGLRLRENSVAPVTTVASSAQPIMAARYADVVQPSQYDLDRIANMQRVYEKNGLQRTVLMPSPTLQKKLETIVESEEISNEVLDQLNCEEFEVQRESQSDPQAHDLAELCIVNSVSIVYADSKEHCVYGLMIAEDVGVTVLHCASACLNVEILSTPGVYYDMVLLSKDRTRDLMIFRVQSCPAKFRNITNHLRSELYTTEIDGHDAMLVTPSSRNRVGWKRWAVVRACVSRKYAGSDVVEHERTYVGMLAGYKIVTGVGTASGDCGSSLILNSARLPFKLIGIHKAATDKVGYAAEIFREDFQEFVPIKEPNRQRALKRDEIELFQEPMPVGRTTQIVGRAVFRNHQSVKTQFYRCPLACPFLDDEFEPVILSHQDFRCRDTDFYPEDAFLKWDGPTGFEIDCAPFSADVRAQIFEMVSDQICDKWIFECERLHRPLFKLTKTEAINRPSQCIGLSNSLNRASSPGYPFRHFGARRGKADFLEFDEGQQIWMLAKNEHGRLLNHSIDLFVDEARRGNVPPIVYVANLKDETRKKDRIYEQPKTRGFAAAPVHYVIAGRMYNYAAMALCAEARAQLGHVLGMDPNSLEWHSMTLRLVSKSNCIINGDYKDFDSGHFREALALPTRIRCELYRRLDPGWRPEDTIIRENIDRASQYGLLLRGHLLFQHSKGIFSGQFDTTFNNCVLNQLYIVYAWFVTMFEKKRFDLMSLGGFDKMCHLEVCGDDFNLSISDLDLFGLQDIVRVLSQHFGIVVTSASAKDSTQSVLPYEDIYEVDFLKRQYVCIGGRWCGRVKMSVFDKMLNWCVGPKRCLTPENLYDEFFDMTNMCALMDVALIEAVFWGRELYEKLVAHFRSFLCQPGIDIQKDLPSYDMMCILFELVPSDMRVFGNVCRNQIAVTDKQMATVKNAKPSAAGVEPQNINVPDVPVSPPDQMSPYAPTATNATQQASQGIGCVPLSVPHIVGKYVWNETISITTNDEPGKVLWWRALHPSTNPYADWLTKPFNAWAGGMLFRATICANFLCAGKVVLVHWMPNQNPTLERTLEEVTCQPHMMCDLKNMETTELLVEDENPTKWHYYQPMPQMNTDPDGNITPSEWFSSLGVGGYIAMYVYGRFNMGEGSLNSLDIIVESAVAPSFTVNYLKSVRSSDTPKPGVAQEAWQTLKDASIPFCPTSPHPNKIIVTPQPVFGFDTVAQMTCGGTFWDTNWWKGDFELAADRATNVGQVNLIPTGTTQSGPTFTATYDTFVNEFVPNKISRVLYCIRGGKFYDWTVGSYFNWNIETRKYEGAKMTYTMEDAGLPASDNRPHLIGTYSMDDEFEYPAYPEDTKKFVPGVPESLIMFGRYDQNYPFPSASFQTQEMVKAFYSKTSKIASQITPTTAGLFMIYDTKNRLPVRQCKLYYEGFLTVMASDKYEIMDSDYELQFMSIVDRNYVIKDKQNLIENSEFAKNQDRIRKATAFLERTDLTKLERLAGIVTQHWGSLTRR
ncbi:hypothetical protein 1 [Hubei picorna-like virus 74]|uniref:hypothetical protein 1 n=1 Tax=Hubei picorna-like virus 74 TaxID=1923158 RepID=UPI00090BBB57|nr:hypothetical protein 1 [Hubei picorna-like virus 74]APG78371.1 hypothetical protein 1 [Hubei picorna-like virus 74]